MTGICCSLNLLCTSLTLFSHSVRFQCSKDRPTALAPKWNSTLCPTEVLCSSTRAQDGWFWMILPTYYHCLTHSNPTKTQYSWWQNQNQTRQFKLLIPKHFRNLSELPGSGEPRTHYLAVPVLGFSMRRREASSPQGPAWCVRTTGLLTEWDPWQTPGSSQPWTSFSC